MFALIWLGCDQSTASLAIYAKLERRFEYFAAIVIKASILVTVSFFTPLALLPVSYLIFQCPEPAHWPRVLHYSYVKRNTGAYTAELYNSILFCSIFFPSTLLPIQANVFAQFYIDWIDQLSACTTFYVFTSTPTVFLIGMYLYIRGIREDLRLAVDASPHATTEIVDAISFHNKAIEYVFNGREFENVSSV